jgi:ABC-type glutathione transport system ATPase component
MNGSLMEYGTMKQVFSKYKVGYTLKIIRSVENENEEYEDEEEERKLDFEAESNGRY